MVAFALEIRIQNQDLASHGAALDASQVAMPSSQEWQPPVAVHGGLSDHGMAMKDFTRTGVITTD